MRRAIQNRRRLVACLLVILLAAPVRSEEKTTLADARRLYLTGDYAAALEAFQKLETDDPPAAIGAARVQRETGEREGAKKMLEAAIERFPKDPNLLAESAELLLSAGSLSSAREHANAALAISAEHFLARYVLAEIDRIHGRMKEAEERYKWFIDQYNEKDICDPDTLRLVGLATAQYARRNALADQYTFLVNELYPDILKIEPNYWQAHFDAGMLYLEKFNEPEAAKSFNAALLINPRAVEAHLGMAQLALLKFETETAERSLARAREVNDKSIDASCLGADWRLRKGQPHEAIEDLEHARALNPASADVLGRLAAVFLMLDGAEKSDRLTEVLAAVKQLNPKPAEFEFVVAGTLDACQRYPIAAQWYDRAIEHDPKLHAARSAQGLMQMRLGDEPRAKKLLERAFEADPFNVRVLNSLKVLDVLSEYATIETDHFIIRFNRGADEFLAQEAADYLETEVYPELTRRFAFEPPEKSLFEIFSRTRNTSGHGWFSARLVGLPGVGTIGACAGKIVALTSPSEVKKQFDWGRVLKHEFVHVLNLQQTDFNTPHWFTEGLAVASEGLPRPQQWKELLAKRARAEKLFTLNTIESGFVRPRSSEDWLLAYCQAELYVEHLQKTFGESATARLLAAYRDRQTTSDALKAVFEVEVADFERGYRTYVDQVVSEMKLPYSAEEEQSLSDLERQHEKSPKDADTAAKLAHELLRRKSYPQARRAADAALAVDPKHQLATYVVARLRLSIGEEAAAADALEAAIERESPQPNALGLLAELRLRGRDYRSAESLFELGRSRWGDDLQWTRGLSRVYLAEGNLPRLAESLAIIAEQDEGSFAARKKLAAMALERQDFAEASRWSGMASRIDVTDAECHRVSAAAAEGLGDLDRAVRKYKTALKLAPDDDAVRVALARAQAKARKPGASEPAPEPDRGEGDADEN